MRVWEIISDALLASSRLSGLVGIGCAGAPARGQVLEASAARIADAFPQFQENRATSPDSFRFESWDRLARDPAGLGGRNRSIEPAWIFPQNIRERRQVRGEGVLHLLILMLVHGTTWTSIQNAIPQ